MKTFQLLILTPFGTFFDESVDFVQLSSEDYTLGILPGHTSLITTVKISKLVVKMCGETLVFATSGGVARVEKESVTLLLDSVENVESIDIDRAMKAKDRAISRIEEAENNPDIDVARAKLSLEKALNRIAIFNDRKH